MNFKRSVLLLFCIVLYAVGLAQTYTLEIGETKFLEVPDPPMDGWISSSAWYCDKSEIYFVEKYDYGTIIKIDSFFSGIATVECMYVYQYLLNV